MAGCAKTSGRRPTNVLREEKRRAGAGGHPVGERLDGTRLQRGKEYKPGYQLHYCRAIIIVYSSTHRFAHHGLFPGPSCDKPLAEACGDETLVLGPRGSLSGVFYFGMHSSTLDHIWALLDAGFSSVDGRPRV